MAVGEDSVISFMTENFEGVESFTSDTGNTFFFYGPEHMIPFVTLVTSDEYDQFSDLNRPGVFRLNIGVSKKTFRSLFGSKVLSAETAGADYNFAELDRIMPHPVYGPMMWVCVLSPGEEIFEASIKPLLNEAYEITTGRRTRRAGRKGA